MQEFVIVDCGPVVSRATASSPLFGDSFLTILVKVFKMKISTKCQKLSKVYA